MRTHVTTQGSSDPLSVYGQYLEVNPNLECCSIYQSPIMAETDRITLTKYRCGSHKLCIEKGRWDKTPRDQRLCSCKIEPQTLQHILYKCPLTKTICTTDVKLELYTQTVDCAKSLRKIEGLFK